jgi:hypothetical protein
MPEKIKKTVAQILEEVSQRRSDISNAELLSRVIVLECKAGIKPAEAKLLDEAAGPDNSEPLQPAPAPAPAPAQ